jgi:hypothetical protein
MSRETIEEEPLHHHIPRNLPTEGPEGFLTEASCSHLFSGLRFVRRRQRLTRSARFFLRLPDDFPVPDALEAMAQAIGNATVGPVQIECDQRQKECTATPGSTWDR